MSDTATQAFDWGQLETVGEKSTLSIAKAERAVHELLVAVTNYLISSGSAVMLPLIPTPTLKGQSPQ